jgi:proteasome accessory factor B
VRAAVRAWDFDPPPQRTGVLRVRSGRGHTLRRHAVSAEPADRPGWDIIKVPYSDSGWWSEQLASFGADIVVLEPADLREAVLARLKGAMA